MPRGPPNAGVLVQVNAPQAKSILQIAEEIEKRNGGQPILEYLSERVTMNLTLFPSSPGRLIRLASVMKDYEEFVATLKPVWVGRELLNDGLNGTLLDKITTFLQFRCQAHKTGGVALWSTATLTCWRWDIQFMVKMSCKPPMSVTEYKEFSIKLLQFTSNVAKDLNLPVSNKKHLLLGPNALRTLMEHNVETGSPFAIEDNLLYLILIHTMARPGSLVTTQAYPDAFFKWGEVKFTRRFADNVVVGVDVELVLKRLKGYQHTTALEIWFNLRTSNDENTLIFDIGMHFMIIALQRGILVDIETAEEIWKGEEEEIQIKPEHLDDPVFFSKQSRSKTSDQPLSYRSCYERLKKQSIATGLVEQGKMTTTYGFRKNSASMLVAGGNIGYEHTRKLMGHRAGSKTLEEVYDHSGRSLDMVGAIMGSGALGTNLYNHPYLHAAARAKALSAANLQMTLADAVEIDPESQNLLYYLRLLQHCIQWNDDAWKQEPLFAKLPRTTSVYHQYAKICTRIKTRIQKLRNMRTMEVLELNVVASIAERRELRQSRLQPSNLPDIVKARMDELDKSLAYNLSQSEDVAEEDGLPFVPTAIHIEVPPLQIIEDVVEEGGLEPEPETDADFQQEGPSAKTTNAETANAETTDAETTNAETTNAETTNATYQAIEVRTTIGDVTYDDQQFLTLLPAKKEYMSNLLRIMESKSLEVEEHKGRAVDKVCQQCEDDLDKPHDYQTKLYDSKRLAKHRVTQYHTQESKFVRYLDNRDPDREQAESGKSKSYKSMSTRCCNKTHQKYWRYEKHLFEKHLAEFPERHRAYLQEKYKGKVGDLVELSAFEKKGVAFVQKAKEREEAHENLTYMYGEIDMGDDEDSENIWLDVVLTDIDEMDTEEAVESMAMDMDGSGSDSDCIP